MNSTQVCVCVGFASNICVNFEYFEQNCIAVTNLIMLCYFMNIFYIRAEKKYGAKSVNIWTVYV